MNNDAVVPLRPGFDNEFRGFSRNQVLEHIELLEDQIKILTTDRDEAIRLNEDQRRITDEARRQMDETTAELKRIETSETGLPNATRRMQSMLTLADEEATSIREHARREAETIRGTASTDAERIRTEAETKAAALREECAALVTDLERQREELVATHDGNVAEISTKWDEVHRTATDRYQEAVDAGQRDANELLRQAQHRCEELDAASHARHAARMDDLEDRAAHLEQCRRLLVDALDSVAGFAATHRTAVVDEVTAIRSGDRDLAIAGAANGSAVTDTAETTGAVAAAWQAGDGAALAATDAQPAGAQPVEAQSADAANRSRMPIQMHDSPDGNGNGNGNGNEQQAVATLADNEQGARTEEIRTAELGTVGVGVTAHPHEYRN